MTLLLLRVWLTYPGGAMIKITSWILGILLHFAVCSSLQAQELPADHSMASYGYKANSRMNFEKLVQLLKAKNATSVESALQVFKAETPEYFNNFVLMYRSQSLQESSYQAPRVLLFDGSAEMIVTFNGDSRHRGYNKLELMQFRADTLAFEFRELEFIEGRLKVSEANPQSCMQCHQSASRQDRDPRPNWEPYNVWPGAYGSQSGSLWEMSDYTRQSLKPQDRILIPEQKKEDAELKKFWQHTRPQHARYQLIDFPSDDSSRFFENIAHQTVSFTDRLSNVSLRRMVRLARQQNPQAFERIKYNFAHLLKCRSLAVHDSARLELIRRVNDQGIFKISDVKTPAETRYASDQGDHQIGGQQVPYSYEIPAHWRHSFSEQLTLLFEPLGVSTLDWSTDFGTRGRFAFVERFGRPSNMNITSFLLEVQEPELSQLSCDNLKVKAADEALALEEYLRANPPLSQIAKPNPERLLQRCISCHSESTIATSGAPWIPFDQPQQLFDKLQTSDPSSPDSLWSKIEYRLSDHATLKDQMPPSLRRPEPEDRRALVEYLRELLRELLPERLPNSSAVAYGP